MATRYRVEQIADEFGHQFHCNRCGELPPGAPGLKAAKARARRHAAANPDHEVWMAHTVMTHFFARGAVLRMRSVRRRADRERMPELRLIPPR